MVGFANERALLAQLANNFALAGRTRAGEGLGIPGGGRGGGFDASGGVPSVGGGGSIPGTATTGIGTANALAASGGGVVPADPVAQQVAGLIGFNNDREPGERGEFGNLDGPGGVTLATNVTGGDAALAMLAGMATGGPVGAALALAEAFATADPSFRTNPATGTQLLNQLNNGGLPFNESEPGDRGGGAPDLGKTDPQTGRASGPV